jgi:hypothetical protein
MGRFYSAREVIRRTLVGCLSVASVFGRQQHDGLSCRVIPGDEQWPTDDTWADFNQSISGRLIRTVPIASVCHGSTYDEEKCATIRDNWFFPETHLPSSSSPMAYEWSNDSCNPFTAPEAPCAIGSHVVYAVNATGLSDYQATLAFAREHNVRLVIRSSGHDYLGKSTGAHALALWTLHLKFTELLPNFKSSSYVGGAMKIGAGVSGGEAQAFAHSHGRVVVVGNCPSVTLAGGWIQGGGHGILSSKYGLGADQVLEFEVITADGRLLTATPSNDHSDLFWALTGGGGGTFGVVLSMTIKTYLETPMSIALLTVPRLPDQDPKAFKSFFSTFLSTLPAILDSGVTVIWALFPTAFMIFPAAGPALTAQELDTLLEPTRARLKELDLPHEYSSATYPDYPSAFASVPRTWNASDYHMNGRLIPRTLVETPNEGLPNEELVDALLHIGNLAGNAGVSYNLNANLP